MLHYITYHHKTATEWVTFVHGAGGSSSIWFKQIREFKKHFNVLLLDLRGHGNSKSSLKNVFNDYLPIFDSKVDQRIMIVHRKLINFKRKIV